MAQLTSNKILDLISDNDFIGYVGLAEEPKYIDGVKVNLGYNQHIIYAQGNATQQLSRPLPLVNVKYRPTTQLTITHFVSDPT